jgi:alpha-ketoglutarate-dependent 2,4-dichlorophenoxyacetate dioxygenase
MALRLTPLNPLFVAEASGIDLRRPLGAGEVGDIDAAMDRYGVLVFRDQPLDQDQQIAFARAFGTLDIGLRRATRQPHRFKYEELIDISNVAADGSIAERDSRRVASMVANQLWHSDSSFQSPAAQYSMLSAVALPSWGGDTEFADLRAAYDGLPEPLKAELDGLVAEHYALHSRMMLGTTDWSEEEMNVLPPVRWPIVRVHPGSGRKLLFIGVHARAIIGWTLPEARLMLSDLLEHATQRQFVHRHQWRVGDLVMWDNRGTLHRGRRYDLAERRELRRTTTLDVPRAPLRSSAAASAFAVRAPLRSSGAASAVAEQPREPHGAE